jgi:hypothetical protein
MTTPRILAIVATTRPSRAAVEALDSRLGPGTPHLGAWVWGVWLVDGDLGLLHRASAIRGATAYLDRSDWRRLAGLYGAEQARSGRPGEDPAEATGDA